METYKRSNFQAKLLKFAYIFKQIIQRVSPLQLPVMQGGISRNNFLVRRNVTIITTVAKT